MFKREWIFIDFSLAVDNNNGDPSSSFQPEFLEDFTEEEEDAATKIQAQFRGFKTRKQLKEKMAEEEEVTGLQIQNILSA